MLYTALSLSIIRIVLSRNYIHNLYFIWYVCPIIQTIRNYDIPGSQCERSLSPLWSAKRSVKQSCIVKRSDWLAAKLTVDFDASHTGIPESTADWELVNVRDHRILCSVMVKRLSIDKNTVTIHIRHIIVLIV